MSNTIAAPAVNTKLVAPPPRNGFPPLPTAKPLNPPAPPASVQAAAPVEKKESKPSDGGLIEVLEHIHDNVSTMAADHRQRVVEFKVAVSEGLRQALGVMEVQSEHIVNLLKANQGLTRTVVTASRDITKAEQTQGDLDGRIVELRDRRDQLGSRVKAQAEEHDSLTTELRRVTEENRERTETNTSLRGQVERLDRENDGLARENQKLERQRERLAADVERATRLREEYQANIKRLKDMHTEMTN